MRPRSTTFGLPALATANLLHLKRPNRGQASARVILMMAELNEAQTLSAGSHFLRHASF